MKLSILFSVLLIAAASRAHAREDFLKNADIESLSWFSYIKEMLKEISQIIWNWNDMCHGYECPKFEAFNTTTYTDYQLRCYPSYAWVGTSHSGDEMPSGDMFMRLYRYIDGYNHEGVKMSMTLPVAIKVQETSNSTKRYTMLFFIPHEYQLNPPTPNNTQVTIIQKSKLCVYVKKFSGLITETLLMKNIEAMKTAMAKDGVVDYIDPDTVYYYGIYNRIQTPNLFRKNEIWIVKQ